MAFKDVVAADIDKVFLNPDEFAESHTINNNQHDCTMDEDKSSEGRIDGVYNMRRRLYISKAALGYRPKPDQKMQIDGAYYYVVDCIGNDLLEVILEARKL